MVSTAVMVEENPHSSTTHFNQGEVSRFTAFLDAIIEKGILFLLIFTPLAMGTVHEWSIAVMEIASYCIFGAWMLRLSYEDDFVHINEKTGGFRSARIVFFMFAFLIILVFLQVIPLPYRLLSFLSPSTGRVYGAFLDGVSNSWFTVSLYSEATWDDILKLLSYAAVFSVIVNHYRTKEQLDTVLKTIVIMGCFLAVFAVVQKMTWNGRLFWFYPLTNGLDSDLAHIWGPYINRNHFAGYMEMAIPVSLGLLMHKLSKIRSPSHLTLSLKIIRFMDNKEFLPAALLFMAVIIMSAGLIISFSRGGLLGFLISSLFFWVMIRSKRSLRKTSGVILLLGVTVFFAVFVTAFSRIEDRFEEINMGDEAQIKRLDIWSDVPGIIKDFPVLGTGLGTFRTIYPQYQTKHSNVIFEYAENDYIQILTELGILGLLAVSGIIFVYSSSVVKAWRSRRNTFAQSIGAGGFSSVVAISVHSFNDFNMRIPANALLLTMVTAATYATVFNIRERRKV